MENSFIKDGFDNLKESKNFEFLYKSILFCSQSDWIIGINFDKVIFTFLYKKLNLDV